MFAGYCWRDRQNLSAFLSCRSTTRWIRPDTWRERECGGTALSSVLGDKIAVAEAYWDKYRSYYGGSKMEQRHYPPRANLIAHMDGISWVGGFPAMDLIISRTAQRQVARYWQQIWVGVCRY